MNKYFVIVAVSALIIAIGIYNTQSTSQDSTPSHIQAAFSKWAMNHGRNYSSPAEKVYRLSVFHKTFLKITTENLSAKLYKLGLNQFSDMTNEEVMTKYGGMRFKPTQRNELFLEDSNQDEVNWVTKGAVSSVKNQGQCGSNWAFAATGPLEAAYFLKGNPLTELSNQQLVDCSAPQGNHGCNGGFMDYAYQYIKEQGIVSEATYPYVGIDGTCKAKGKQTVTKITKFVDVPANSYQQTINAIINLPISVAMDFSQMQSYQSGIFNGSCGTNLSHGLTAVGYGSQNGTLYWLLKNDWGTTWGEQGYMRLIRTTQDGTGKCGVLMVNSYPVI